MQHDSLPTTAGRPSGRSSVRETSARQGGQKRARILAAAHDLCARKGFDATRMEEIAAAAGVSKGTLYNFFESKDDLVVATVLQSYEDHHLLVPQVGDPGMGPLERLEALGASMLESFPPTAARMPLNFQAWALVARDPALRRRLFAALRPIYADNAAAIQEALEQGRARGLVRPDVDLESVTRVCLATFDGLIYRSTFDPEGANTEALSAALEVILGPVLCREGEA